MASPKKEQYRSSYLLFFPLLFIVLILEIVRLPAAASQYRPDILGVMLIFFAMTDPKRINIGMAWISGLLLDILSIQTLPIIYALAADGDYWHRQHDW